MLNNGPLTPIPMGARRKRRHAGWIRIHSEIIASARWWVINCELEHDANSTSRWWMARWERAVASALEHLAAHAVKRVPLRPFDEVGVSDVTS